MVLDKKSAFALLDLSGHDDDAYARALVGVAGKFTAKLVIEYLTATPPSPRVVYLLMVAAQDAANKKRSSGGGKAKAAKDKGRITDLLAAFNTGRFKDQKTCAEEEYEACGYKTLKAAENALSAALKKERQNHK